jgi:N12 class adenine-specific DNA methylase/2'-5' RNA ligase
MSFDLRSALKQMSEQDIARYLSEKNGLDYDTLRSKNLTDGQITSGMLGISPSDYDGIVKEEFSKANYGDIERGLIRAGHGSMASYGGMAAMGGSLLKKAGADELGQRVQDAGMDVYRKHEAQAALHPKDEWGESKSGYIIGTGAELLPIMGEVAVGSMVTGGGFALGKKILEKGVETAVKKRAKKIATETALKTGMKVGAGATVFPLETGSMYGELKDRYGVDAPFSSSFFGGLATAMEYIPGGNLGIVDKMFQASSIGRGDIVKAIAKELLQAMPSEAVQEAGQETMAVLNTVVNTDEKFLTLDNLKQIGEAGAAGLIGGGMGAPVRVGAAAMGSKAGQPGPEPETESVQPGHGQPAEQEQPVQTQAPDVSGRFNRLAEETKEGLAKVRDQSFDRLNAFKRPQAAATTEEQPAAVEPTPAHEPVREGNTPVEVVAEDSVHIPTPSPAPQTTDDQAARMANQAQMDLEAEAENIQQSIDDSDDPFLNPPETKAEPAQKDAEDLPDPEPKEKTGFVHDHTNTQVNIKGEQADRIREFGKTIPEKEIYTDPEDDSYGREDEPHITVKYGLKTNDPGDIKPIIENHPPVKAKMGQVSIFENDKFDVVKVEVDSPELRALNEKIEKEAEISLPKGETFEYTPHATIAYVKPGSGKKYVGDKSFDGQEITFDEITVSTRDGKQHQIKLLGEPVYEEVAEKQMVEADEVESDADLQPGQAVTWQNKKGKEFSGILKNKRGKTWVVRKEDGKQTFVNEKDLVANDGQVVTETDPGFVPKVVGRNNRGEEIFIYPVRPGKRWIEHDGGLSSTSGEPKQLFDQGKTRFLTNDEVHQFKATDEQSTGNIEPDEKPSHKDAKALSDIQKTDGTPFKTKAAAQAAINKADVSDNHEPVNIDGGWVGREQAAKAGPSRETEIINDFVERRIEHDIDDGKKLGKEASKTPKKQTGYGSKNKVFTADTAEKARALLKQKLSGNQLNSGLDPEIMQAGLQLAGYHIEAGARSFAAYSKAMIDDIGEAIRPYLRSFYEGVRHYPGFESNGMDSAADIDKSQDTEYTEKIDRETPDVTDNDGGQREAKAADDSRRLGDEGSEDVQGTQEQPPAESVSDPDGAGDDGGVQRGMDTDSNRVQDKPAEGREPDRIGGEDEPGTHDSLGSNSGNVLGFQRSDYSIKSGELDREGGWKTTAKNNLDAVELYKKITSENRQATKKEQAILAKYVGWGATELANNVFAFIGSDGKARLNWFKPGWEDLSKRAIDLLSEEELRTAARSTQYAHYTSEPVVRSIYKALGRMGFSGGKILEPGAGVGNFIGLLPPKMRKHSVYTGIEMDHVSAGIAKLLYPNQNILRADFVKSKFPPNFFDAAIGNPPFSSTKILADPEYKTQRFNLHNYFFAKSMDRVRPGGLLVFVTSRYTMDTKSDKARKYLADRADLLGAIRLPQTAFKKSAGTEVVTDVLFLQKREDGAEHGGEAWTGQAPVEIGGDVVHINEYFAAHPEMVLGEHSKQGSMYGSNEYTVTPLDGEIADHFEKAAKKLPSKVYNQTPEKISKRFERRAIIERDFNPANKKEGGLYIKDGHLMKVEFGSGVALEKIPAKTQAFLKSYISLRDALKDSHKAQLEDGDWEKALADLNKAYDKFVKKHGNILAYTLTTRTKEREDGTKEQISTRRYKNEKALNEDVESPLVMALERIDNDGNIEKSAILNGRTIKRPTTPEIKSVPDALAVSLDQTGWLDVDHVAELAGKPVKEVVDTLGDLIFEEPDGSGYVMADEYLSGNVVLKLEEARAAARLNDKFLKNVEALEKNQPPPLKAEDITVNPGVNWIPSKYYEQFTTEILDLPQTVVEYSAVDGSFKVSAAENDWGDVKYRPQEHRSATNQWATEYRAPNEIFESLLNNRTIRITYTVRENGSTKTVFDEKATAAVSDLAKQMRARFQAWVWEDAERAATLLDLYNSKINVLKGREFDGSHLTLPGMSQHIVPYDHQKRGIWRMIQTGNSYLAHAVGAGKTLAMIAAGMEMKRLGLIRKPLYVVPKHMLSQFGQEFQAFYPMANIMVADEKNFNATNRKRFVAQAALNDPDAIILTHSSFGLLKVREETLAPVREKFIEQMRLALEELEDDDAPRMKIKRMEKRIESAEQRFDSMISGGDNVVTFEELGVDYLFLDEAHEFRKLDFITNRQMKGIDPNGSKRAIDLYIKTLWLEGQSPGRSHTFASGTPITNTLGELYTLMRFFNEDGRMEADGIDHFDAWASMFGEPDTDYEMNSAGRYEPVERFSRFVNMPELMTRVRQFMDVLTSSQLGTRVRRPEIRGGAPEIVLAPRNEALKQYQDEVLQPRIETSRDWKPSKEQPGNPDPIINIITDGRLASIDMRFVNPLSKNDPDSKLNEYIDGIIKGYQETKDFQYDTSFGSGKKSKVKGAAQICFYNSGFGKSVTERRGFDSKAWVMKRFGEAGIPSDQVAWIDDYGTAPQKQALFKDVRDGKKKVLLGSAKKMGTGVNVQNRLAILHYLDAPWYPADVEQPDGRIVRQGNQNDEVQVKRYATQGSYDATMWQMVARKSRFIEQAFLGDTSVRSIEDISETSQYAMAAAIASGDDRVIKLVELRTEIERLSLLKSSHQSTQANLAQEKRWIESNIKAMGGWIEELEEIEDRLPEYIGKDIQAKVGRTEFTKRAEFGPALKKKLIESSRKKARRAYPIGVLNGVNLSLDTNRGITPALYASIGDFEFQVVQFTTTQIKEADELGLVTRIANQINKIPSKKAEVLNEIERGEKKLERVKRALGAPFGYARDLAEKIKEAALLEKELAEEGEDVPETSGRHKDIGVTAFSQQQFKEMGITEPHFTTSSDQTPGHGITLKDIQKRFKGQEVFISPDGSYSVRMKNGQGIKITNVKEIAGGDMLLALETGQMDEKGVILGKTVGTEIALNSDMADTFTLDHETKHVLENLGMITPNENLLLQAEFNRLKKRKGGLKFNPSQAKNKKKANLENITNMFAQVLADREEYRGTKLGALIQKVLDFLDALRHLGRESIRKLARETESGKIFNRPAKTVPVFQQEKAHSNRKFKNGASSGISGSKFPNVEIRQTGEIQVPEEPISGSGDIAGIFSTISDAAQEEAWGVTTDKDGRILEVHKFSKGLSEEAPGHVNQMTAHLLKNKDASVSYIVHNHPVGAPYPSEEDLSMLKAVQASLGLSKIQAKGVVIADGWWNEFDGRDVDIPQEIVPLKKGRIEPVGERRIVSRSDKKLFQIDVDNPEVQFERFENEEDGVLLTDGSGQEIAFIPYPKGKTMRDATIDILDKAGKHNAIFAVINARVLHGTNRWKFYGRLAEGLHSQGIKVLDFITEHPATGPISLEKEGKMYEDKTSGMVALNSDEVLFQTSAQRIQDEFDKAEENIFHQVADFFLGNKRYWKDMGEGSRDDITAFAKLFKTTMYNANKIGGAAKRAFEVFRKQTDWKFEKQNEILFEGDHSLQGVLEDYRKEDPDGYKALNKYFVEMDRMARGHVVKETDDGKFGLYHWKKKGDERIYLGQFETEDEAWDVSRQIEAEESGLNERGQDALVHARKITRNLYKHYSQDMKDAIEAYRKAGMPIPEVAVVRGGKTVQVNLEVLSREMGDRQGYYFPRLRQSGQYRVFGEKGEKKELRYFDTRILANRYRAGLDRRGYKTKMTHVGKLGEDIYQGLKPLFSLQQTINKTLAEMSNKDKQRVLEDRNITTEWRGDTLVLKGAGVNLEAEEALKPLGGEYVDHFERTANGQRYRPEIHFKEVDPAKVEELEANITRAVLYSGHLFEDMDVQFAEAFARQFDAVLKGRGSRARMIGRGDAKGDEVSRGYEEDLITALVQTTNSAAGGYAKGRIAKEASAAIMGRDISWQDFQKENGGDKLADLERQLSELELTSQQDFEKRKIYQEDLRKLRGGLLNQKFMSLEEVEQVQADAAKLQKKIDSITQYADPNEARRIKAKIGVIKTGMFEAYQKMTKERSLQEDKQGRIYSDITATMEDILRNEEAADRVIGTLKGLAVWKYLGFRVSSAAINVTNMITGVPAALTGETDGDVSIRSALKHVGIGMKEYGLSRVGKSKYQDLFDEIHKKGLDEPKFNREAFTALQSKLGRGWNRFMETSMLFFGATERMNRAATIAGAYLAMKEANKGGAWDHEDMLMKAREISDFGHGLYEKANRPYHMRGQNIGARVLQMAYVFQTFTHNYIQEMARLGLDKKQYNAALYMAFSPAIFGIGSTIPVGIARAISSALGGDDPEEKMIQLAEDNLGLGNFARYGITGMGDHGISLKGSLATRFGTPESFLDIFGAPGSVVADIWQGGENITKGYYQEGFEKIAPAAFGNISRGIREATEGVTTRTGAPVYFGREQVKGDALDAILRILSFNPTHVAKKRDIQWNEYKIKSRYQRRKSELFKRLKRFYNKPQQARNRNDLLMIKADIRAFNEEVRSKGIKRVVPLITDRSIKQTLRSTAKPPKRERLRARE